MDKRRLVFDKWAEALLSGDYEQGVRRLHCHGKWCCLGVLCDILYVPYIEKDGDRYYLGQDLAGLPNKVVDLLGISALGALDYSTLATENDNGKSFAEIAELIPRLVLREPLDRVNGYYISDDLRLCHT